MKLAIDLRGLNYPIITGVNTYTLHLLWLLNKVKKQTENLKITAIGIKRERLIELQDEFPFLLELLDENIDLPSYLHFKKIPQSGFWINLWLLWKCFWRDINYQNCLQYDVLFLPQPKLIVKNPSTKLVVSFHDLFGTIERKSLTWKQRIVNNLQNFQVIAVHSDLLWCNSISTGKDLMKFLNIPQNKIKLVYPALPIWQEFRKINPINPRLNSPLENTGTAWVSQATTSPKGWQTKSDGVVFELLWIFKTLKLFLKKDSRQIVNQPENSNTFLDEKISKENYILALSGIETRKNWYNLLLAHKFLQENYPDWQYVLVLSGALVNKNYYEKLQRLIYKFKIKNVLWKINPNEITKNQLLQNCLFLVYPSHYEGFGFPILEAFTHNKTVLTSKISSMPEIAKNSAVYVNPLNYRDIASGLYILATDTQFRNTLQQTTQINLEQFHWQEMQIALKNLIDANSDKPIHNPANY